MLGVFAAGIRKCADGRGTGCCCCCASQVRGVVRCDQSSMGDADHQQDVNAAVSLKRPRPVEASDPDDGAPARSSSSGDGNPFRNLFQKELRQMMYGSGDVSNPLPESLDLIEDLTVEFIMQMTRRAAQVAGSRDRVRTEDLLFAIRDNPRMYARACELLRMNRIVNEATKKDAKFKSGQFKF